MHIWLEEGGTHLAIKGFLPSFSLKKGSLPWLGFPTSLLDVFLPTPY